MNQTMPNSIPNPLNPPLPEPVMVKVEGWKRELIWRVRSIGLTVERDRIVHLIEGDEIYVLANPVVAKEAIYNDFGEPTGEYVERRNFEMVYQPLVTVRFENAPDSVKDLYRSWGRMHIEPPRTVVVSNPTPMRLAPIMLPMLAVKLSMDGQLLVDGGAPHQAGRKGES